ncbi:hypothetical protein HAX54_027375 [Datura stramonium]|uniref:Uncharacterized protein n=1 Tax=Datura stramonium TaxID=4076 RepID=A0ABS8V2I3_DATST|nr:hypothetical protein [Datura stramonium]
MLATPAASNVGYTCSNFVIIKIYEFNNLPLFDDDINYDIVKGYILFKRVLSPTTTPRVSLTSLISVMREERTELEDPPGGLSFLEQELGGFWTRVEEDSGDSSEDESKISTWHGEEDDLLRHLLERRVFRTEDFSILMRKKEGVPDRRFKRRRDRGKGGEKV